jgi:hypothetical protein
VSLVERKPEQAALRLEPENFVKRALGADDGVQHVETGKERKPSGNKLDEAKMTLISLYLVYLKPR